MARRSVSANRGWLIDETTDSVILSNTGDRSTATQLIDYTFLTQDTQLIAKETPEFYIERFILWFSLEAALNTPDERGFKLASVSLAVCDVNDVADMSQLENWSVPFINDTGRLLRQEPVPALPSQSSFAFSGAASQSPVNVATTPGAADGFQNGQFPQGYLHCWDFSMPFNIREDHALYLFAGNLPAQAWEDDDSIFLTAYWKALVRRRRQ